MLVMGADEAGRGPIIGPLVIAGVSIDSDRMDELVSLGVKDSKLLSPSRREDIYGKLRSARFVRISVVKYAHDEIDEAVRLKCLNYLEAGGMAAVIADLKPESAILDCPDPRVLRYGKMVRDCLDPGIAVEIIPEHYADLNYPVVGAASIVAKVERDAEIKKLHEVYGDFGSGYTSDAKTIGFLKAWLTRTGERPEFSRKSWKTWKRIERSVHAKPKAF